MHTVVAFPRAADVTAPPSTTAFRAYATLRLLVFARLQAWTRDRLLGFWWWLLEPLCLSVGYFVVVKALRGSPAESLLFLASALLPWSWFTAATGLAQQSLVRNATLLKAVPANFALFPSAEVIAASIRFLPALVVWVMLLAYEQPPLSASLCYLPLILLIQGLFTLAVSWHLALLQARLPDAAQIWNVVVRFWFLVSPGLYELRHAPEALQPWLRWNPFTPLLEAYRDILVYGKTPPLGPLAWLCLASMLIAAGGYVRLSHARGRLPLWL